MMTSKHTVVLGIDPGYDRIGWAVGQISRRQLKLQDYGCLTTSKKLPLMQRYQQLIKQTQQLIKKFRPQQLAIESLFFFKNKKTALKVSEARGVMLAELLKQQVKVFEYTPLQIKQAVTGYGRANKQAVAKMVRLQLKLTQKKIIDDAIDALAVLITHQVSNHDLIS
ncbi:MAG: crossover junction endodeoxyribonuclease RuvC [Candidatus Pacebacteria bacterium]|nr:crossover junction endodeoxyribonuclease RuvC [Candidatus Paceibacterota bacterium]